MTHDLTSGTMDTWLMYKLTGGVNGGVYVTDISNAARTNLMDIRSRQWHPKTCSYFGLEVDMLPEIKSNAEVFGYVKDGPLKGEMHMLVSTSLLYSLNQARQFAMHLLHMYQPMVHSYLHMQ